MAFNLSLTLTRFFFEDEACAGCCSGEQLLNCILVGAGSGVGALLAGGDRIKATSSTSESRTASESLSSKMASKKVDAFFFLVDAPFEWPADEPETIQCQDQTMH